MKTRIQLSDHFTYTKLIRFVIPSIMTMIFTSIYGVVDGLFVSNYVGKVPFAAINLIYPVLTILGAVGFMLGTGGTAIVGKTLGEGKPKQANEYFSMIIWVGAAAGTFLAVLGFIFLPMLSRILGAKENMIADCVLYGRIIMIALPFYLLQNMFHSYLVVAEKPKIAFAVTVMSGVTNIVFDALFIAGFKWGITGAALATALSQVVGGLVPLFYFMKKNSSLLQITKSRFNGKILLDTCINGSSEMVTNLASAFINMLLNRQLMRIAGENGVAAFGVIMYVSFIFSAIFFGYAVGCSPIISYHYGAGDTNEVKNLLHKSLKLTFLTGIFMMLAVLLLADPLSQVFVGYDKAVADMTIHAFHVYLIAFFFSGFNVFGSAFFTALNNGKISAILSFSRTLLFEATAALILPNIFGIDGVWSAGVIADLLAMIMTFSFLYAERKKYHYA